MPAVTAFTAPRGMARQGMNGQQALVGGNLASAFFCGRGEAAAAHGDQKGGYQWQITSEWRNGNSKIC